MTPRQYPGSNLEVGTILPAGFLEIYSKLKEKGWRAVEGVRKGETVEVQRLVLEKDCSFRFQDASITKIRLNIRMDNGKIMCTMSTYPLVPNLSRIAAKDPSEAQIALLILEIEDYAALFEEKEQPVVDIKLAMRSTREMVQRDGVWIFADGGAEE